MTMKIDFTTDRRRLLPYVFRAALDFQAFGAGHHAYHPIAMNGA